MQRGLTRRQGLAAALGGALGAAAGGASAQEATRESAMETRRIPSSGETVPVIGLGTSQVFNVGPEEAARRPLAQVIEALFAAGGSVIDTSPMYGKSEGVAGDLIAAADARKKAFIATKVWTEGREAGIAQMQRSLGALHTDHVDLMQVHNLIDTRTHLATLRDWKAKGTVRYIGVTHYTETAYDELASVMRAERLDFVQFNYSLEERAAEQTLLPLAAERGIAVLVNRPLGRGSALRRLRDKPLPNWAGEIGCTSWAQVVLKYAASHPAVTCVIPATGNSGHMRDNAAAGRGPMPDAAMRRRMVEAFEA